MKKYWLLIIFIWCNLHTAVSQVHFGAKIGYLHSKTAREINDDYHNSISGGLVCSYNFPNNFSLRGDLLYSTREYKVPEGVLDENTLKDVKVKFHYIDIPVLLEYKPSPFIVLETGPFIGMQIKGLYIIIRLSSHTLCLVRSNGLTPALFLE